MATPRASSCHTPALAGADWDELLRHLPADLEGSARAAGAWQRRRKVASPGALLRRLLLYCLEDWSLRLACAWGALLGLGELSESALRQRLGRSRPWLGARVAALVARPAPVGRAGRVRLIDATAGSAPGGGRADRRAHVGYDLARAAIDALELTDARGGETLRRQRVEPGDILVADAGHSHPAGLAWVLGQGGEAVVRWAWQTLPLQTPEGRPLEALPWLRALPPGAAAERPAVARSPSGPLGLRLVARRLPAPTADAARRRLRRRAQTKGRTPSARSLELAGSLVLATSLPAAGWDAEDVLALYRLRWQVELAFKRLKGLWLLDAGRARGPAGQAYLLGTLLAALLAARAHGALPEPGPAWFAAVERPLSLWRWEALGRLLLRQAVLGHVAGADLAAALPRLQRYLCDAPRRRRAQQAAAGRAWLATQPALRRPPPPSPDYRPATPVAA